MMTFSEKESDVLGVRIARGVLPIDWQPEVLLQETFDGQYDFLRLKLPSNDEQVFEKLEMLGMPYSLHSILVRNSIAITAEHAEPHRPLRVDFELYDGSNEEGLKQLVKDSWGNRTAVNYHNPNFRNWVSYEQEMEGSAAYSAEFNYTINPDMPNWIVRLQGKAIGFVLGKVSAEGFEGIMYSILPAYRGRNYAEDIMLFLKKWCYQEGIHRFYNDVVFQNMASLKSIVNEAIVPVETYLNLTLSPLLSANKGLVIHIDGSSINGTDDLLQWVAANKRIWEQGRENTLVKMRTTMNFSGTGNIESVKVSMPIVKQSSKVILLSLMCQSKIIGAVYLEYNF